MNWDHMGWQLQLEELIADANLHANEAARHLIDNSLAEALVSAQAWERLQQEIQAHMSTMEEKRGATKP